MLLMQEKLRCLQVLAVQRPVQGPALHVSVHSTCCAHHMLPVVPPYNCSACRLQRRREEEAPRYHKDGLESVKLSLTSEFSYSGGDDSTSTA